ncbi:hypothetical protein NLJ89_g10364 [Agrocybe chaxingu]|uniref:Uncharacterized protein n=1 Tax=Agrocybe chaxingu TaxID=84603 RepID=A0A9W8JRA0_9AGAR|nr:hypothetical protein NLJ89_g10364 [Agrocybe chaxingu]
MELAQWTAKRKLTIYNWYNNHQLNKGRRSGKVGKSVQIALQPSGSRIPSEAQIFSKKYYETLVKPLVDLEISEDSPDNDKRIAIINRVTAEVYEKQPDELKAEIRTEREAHIKTKEAMKEALKTIIAPTEQLTPAALMLAQAALPDMIQDFIDALGDRTHWSFTVLAGGPCPARDGVIRTIAVHTGTSVHGHHFAKGYGKFKENVLAPYSKFLHNVYPPAVCETFCLPPVDAPQPLSVGPAMANPFSPVEPATSQTMAPVTPTVVAPAGTSRPWQVAVGTTQTPPMTPPAPATAPRTRTPCPVPAPAVPPAALSQVPIAAVNTSPTHLLALVARSPATKTVAAALLTIAPSLTLAFAPVCA